MEKYLVQQRKDHGKWETRWSFEDQVQAEFHYVCLNTWGKWRKRLIGPDGNVIVSQYPTRMSA